MAVDSLITSSFLLVMVLITTFPSKSFSLPFVVLTGLGSNCSDVTEVTEFLSNSSASQGYCIEIGNGRRDSFFRPIEEQAEIACDKVKEMKEFSEGFNLVAFSQGCILGRAVIQFCDGLPPINNMVAIGGPNAGAAEVPCNESVSEICKLVKGIAKSRIYTEYIQARVAPSNYFKIPTQIPAYLEGCKLLPKLNNELPDERNATYKERFTRLQNLVLIMFENDRIVIPKESSWFGYYPDGAFEPVLPPQQTKLYIEDWIGLRTLDEAGKVKYFSVPGGHVEISQSELIKYVVPYLKDESVTDETAASSNQGTFWTQ